MKNQIYILTLLVFFSCAKKDRNYFTIDLPHYSSQIKIEGLKEFDTLVSWDWYNDNMADDRKCFRIQDSKLGIVLEKGMLPEKARLFNQMTIKIPIKPNKFGKLNIKTWLDRKKDFYHLYDKEYQYFKFPVIDSIVIDGRKFAVISIEGDYTDKRLIRVFYGTNINNERIVFEFKTNIHKTDSFYLKTMNSMKTIKIKPAANNGYK